MKKLLIYFYFLCLFFSFLPFTVSGQQQLSSGNISFQPNMIPFLNVTAQPFDKPESFRFEWKGNKFDIELFFNATLQRIKQGVTTNTTKIWSLRDFETDFTLNVNYVVNKNETHASFGWMIDNPSDADEWVWEAWMKIENTFPFDYDAIEVEVLDTFVKLGYNQTRFLLPDNLTLDFEDLRHKGFVIGNLNKTTTHIKGFEGKSSWNLDPITYSTPTMTVTGTYSTTSIGWEFWNASNVNGWNVAWNNRNNNTQYQWDCLLQIGDGSTTTVVNAFNEEWVFSDYFRTANYQACVTVKNKATLTLGVLVSASTKSTSQGVTIIDLEDDYYTQQFATDTSTAVANMYSLTVIPQDTSSALARSYFYGGKAYNCMFLGKGGATVSSTIGEIRFTNMDIYNVYTARNFEGLSPRGTSTCDTLKVFDSYRALLPVGSSQTISNVYARGNTYLVSVDWRYNHYLINVDADSWTLVQVIAGSAEVYRQYQYDLTTTANSTIEITYYGQGGGAILNTTDADGIIPTQTISKGFYNSTGVSTIYSYEPFHLKISKTGYQTYEANFTLTQKTSWEVFLQISSESENNLAVGFVLGLIILLPIILIVYVAKKH